MSMLTAWERESSALAHRKAITTTAAAVAVASRVDALPEEGASTSERASFYKESLHEEFEKEKRKRKRRICRSPQHTTKSRRDDWT